MKEIELNEHQRLKRRNRTCSEKIRERIKKHSHSLMLNMNMLILK